MEDSRKIYNFFAFTVRRCDDLKNCSPIYILGASIAHVLETEKCPYSPGKPIVSEVRIQFEGLFM